MEGPTAGAGAGYPEEHIVLGVVADTHIPDRLTRFPPAAVRVLHDAGARAILHAGDFCRPRVLHELADVAPVIAVRGNRDVLWPANWRLPARRVVRFGDVRVGLVHGHPPLGRYALQKLGFEGSRETLEAVERRLLGVFRPRPPVIVYGHSHVPRVRRVDGTLLLNPGSLAPPHFTDQGATLGLLRIHGGNATPEIVTVD